MTASEQPLFDDTRKALVFALNASDVQMPRPAMTKAMASGTVKAKKKAKKAKRPSYVTIEEMAEEMDKEHAERRALVRAAFRRRQVPLTGLEKAAQAGFILAELAKLPHPQQSVLTGLLMRSHRPCDCRAPCCSGFAINLRWNLAVSETCNLLKEGGYGPQGKRSLSTQPALRRAVVEAHFTKRERSLIDLANLAGCSQVTAAKHRAWIIEILEEVETEAWQEIAALLDAAGITGTFTD